MAGQPESVAVLFETALALQPSERKAFLDQECGRDTALRQSVENLLAEDARAGSFLKHPAIDFLEKLFGWSPECLGKSRSRRYGKFHVPLASARTNSDRSS